MKIRLVSHASIIFDCGDAQVWTDPWLSGKVFNDSWALLPEPAFDKSLLASIDYLWLSHEHPDHFNIPTLLSLPSEFKQRVTVLFQARNSAKVFETLRKLGFRNFLPLSHREPVPLTDRTRVYCYEAGTMDSCLAVHSDGETAVNLNDCRLNRKDCHTILSDLDVPRVDVVLNQFSMAVYRGMADHDRYLPVGAMNVLESLSANHRDLRARHTIPFASFIYWSAADNRYMNAYMNQPRDVVEFCRKSEQDVVVLYPGDEYQIGSTHDSEPALKRFDKLYEDFDSIKSDAPMLVPFAQIVDAFNAMSANLRERFPQAILRRLQPLGIHIPDLGTSAIFSLAEGTSQIVDEDSPDLVIWSQPLHFCFSQPYGAQTLAISARYKVIRNYRVWRMHHAVFALNNAGVYLRPRYWLRRRTLTYLRDRARGFWRYTDRTQAA